MLYFVSPECPIFRTSGKISEFGKFIIAYQLNFHFFVIPGIFFFIRNPRKMRWKNDIGGE